MSDPIRAALDAAANRLCFGHDGADCDMCVAPEHCYKSHVDRRKDAAAAIAAFLRAVPVITDLPPGPDRMGFWDAPARERWAAAVEKAAADE